MPSIQNATPNTSGTGFFSDSNLDFNFANIDFPMFGRNMEGDYTVSSGTFTQNNFPSYTQTGIGAPGNPVAFTSLNAVVSGSGFTTVAAWQASQVGVVAGATIRPDGSIYTNPATLLVGRDGGTTSGTWTGVTNSITVTVTTNLYVGQYITGSNIGSANQNWITSIVGTTVGLQNNTTATGTGVTITAYANFTTTHASASTSGTSTGLNMAPPGVVARSCDSATAKITAIAVDNLTLTVTDTTSNGINLLFPDFSPGDAVLVINMQGSATFNGNVGNWEIAKIATVPNGVTSGTITLTQPLANVYGNTDNTSLSAQRVQLKRIPEYGTLTLSGTGIYSSSAWPGAASAADGGIVALFAQSIVFSGSGKISADTFGYGINNPTPATAGGFQGEGHLGVAAASTSANGSGGGGGGTGVPGVNGSGGAAGGGGGYGAAGGAGATNGAAGGGLGLASIQIGNGYTVLMSATFPGQPGGGGGNGSTGGSAPGTATVTFSPSPNPNVTPGTSPKTYGPGTAGQPGSPVVGGTAGTAVGGASLAKLYLGGQGGTGGKGGNSTSATGATTGGGGGAGTAPGPSGGPANNAPAAGASGGKGGGIVLVFARNITSANITAIGGNGSNGGPGGVGITFPAPNPGVINFGAPGGGGGGGGSGSGGGAGGTIYVFAQTYTLNAVTAAGGTGGTGGTGGAGGTGSPGGIFNTGAGTPSGTGGTPGAGGPGAPGAGAAGSAGGAGSATGPISTPPTGTGLWGAGGGGGGGSGGFSGGNGSGGRVKFVYLTTAGVYASSTADGPSAPFAPAGPIAGTGYKGSL